MKTYRNNSSISLVILGLIVLNLFFVTSCQYEDIENEEEIAVKETSQEQMGDASRSLIEDRPLQEQLNYKKTHLLAISQFISDNKTQIQGYLEPALMSAHDSLYPIEFKVKDVLDDLHIDYTSVNSSFDAFSDLDSLSWDPVLIIPYKSNTIVNGSYDSTDPIYAIADYDLVNEVETESLYMASTGGTLMSYTTPMQESQAMYYLVHYLDLISDGEVGGGGSSSGSGSGGSYYRLKINRLKPKDGKETWVQGKSEIHFKGYKLSFLPSTSGYCGDHMYSSSDCYDYYGKRIKRVKRSDIGDEFMANFTIEDYTTYQNSDMVFYVIFEYDGWPAPKKQWDFPFVNGEYRAIEYRTWNSAYHKKMVSMDPTNTYGLPFARSYSLENSAIKYDLD